jgi:hypothetical protein
MFLSAGARFKYNLQRKRKPLNILVYKKMKLYLKLGRIHLDMVGCYYRPGKETLGMSISKEQNMFVAIERFISDVVEEHGEHPVSTDSGTWYPHQAC